MLLLLYFEALESEDSEIGRPRRTATTEIRFLEAREGGALWLLNDKVPSQIPGSFIQIKE